MTNQDERLRILKLIERGNITAEEGGQLIEALERDHDHMRMPVVGRTRSLRVVVTDMAARRQKVNVTIPVTLVNVGLKLGARLFPRESEQVAADIRTAIEQGATGRIFDMQDLQEQERIEIFIEQSS